MQQAGLELPPEARETGEARCAAAVAEALESSSPEGVELLRALAHHLRNPLTCMYGYLELFSDGSLGPTTEDQTRVLRIMSSSMTRLAALVDGLEPRDPAARHGD